LFWFSTKYGNFREITKLSARGSGCVFERFDSYAVIDVIGTKRAVFFGYYEPFSSVFVDDATDDFSFHVGIFYFNE
jgi:hypothetical protein